VNEDFVTRAERRFKVVEERAQEAFKRIVETNVPRPIGSEKVSPGDDLEEYILTVAMAPDPKAAFRRRIEERVAEGYSTEQALTWAVDWAERNEKRIGQRTTQDGATGALSGAPAIPAVVPETGIPDVGNGV
jgi:hypothetical protein